MALACPAAEPIDVSREDRKFDEVLERSLRFVQDVSQIGKALRDLLAHIPFAHDCAIGVPRRDTGGMQDPTGSTSIQIT
jgi:hypothetical protein